MDSSIVKSPKKAGYFRGWIVECWGEVDVTSRAFWSRVKVEPNVKVAVEGPLKITK